MTEEQRQAAMSAGRHAARTGRAVTDCPYSQQGDATDRALAGAWVREYLREQPAVNVSYD